MAVAIYAVQVLLRIRTEEAEGRLEPVLAAAVSRPRWLIANLLNAGLGAGMLLLAFAASMGVAAGAVLGDIPAELRALLGAALVQLPAILLIAGAVIALTALLPRAAGHALVGARPRGGPARPTLRRRDSAAAGLGAGHLAVYSHPKASGRRPRGAPRPQPDCDRRSACRRRSRDVPTPQPCPPDLAEATERRQHLQAGASSPARR